MDGKYKLGISRSRVFALENCAHFAGVTGEKFEQEQLVKSVSMLGEKYPLLRCVIELGDGGEAYAVRADGAVQFYSLSGDADQIIADERRRGFDFSKELFRIVLINGITLALFGHTAVFDVHSLALLAAELVRFYRRESFDVEERLPELFGEKSDLPDNATSGVAERIANSLNFSWMKHDRRFTNADFLKAEEAYLKSRPQQKRVHITVLGNTTAELLEWCRKTNNDVSAAAAFYVFTELQKLHGFSGGDRHVLWQCNERLFLTENEVYGIGPYNSAAAVKVPRAKKKGLTPFDDFQDETYKKHATCFSAFYDTVYMMEILPQLCDAAHLCEAGTFRNRTAKSLAKKEFNMRGCALGCGFFNFDQKYWERIKCFETVDFSEPFSRRCRAYLNLMLKDGELRLELTYRDGEISDEDASFVLKNAVHFLTYPC